MNYSQKWIVFNFFLFSAILYALRGFESLPLYGIIAIISIIAFVYYGTIGKPQEPSPYTWKEQLFQMTLFHAALIAMMWNASGWVAASPLLICYLTHVYSILKQRQLTTDY